MLDKLESSNLFVNEWEKIAENYTGIKLIKNRNIPVLSGCLQLIDGVLCDEYLVEIHWQRCYPFCFPLVFETGGRIPQNINWHVFESDGHCCIKTSPEEIIPCNKGIKLFDFIEKEVKPYFFNQSFREKNGYFLNERPHGVFGDLQFFEEILNTKELSFIEKVCVAIVSGKTLKSTDKCICGSDKKYKKCHGRSIKKLSLLNVTYYKEVLNKISIIQKAA
jgi:SEC-C motif